MKVHALVVGSTLASNSILMYINKCPSHLTHEHAVDEAGAVHSEQDTVVIVNRDLLSKRVTTK